MQELLDFIANTVKWYEWEDNNLLPMQKIRPVIRCKDGESVSIQASETHYCSPRESGLRRYGTVEAGFPSVTPPDSWRKYAEDWERIGLRCMLKDIWRSTGRQLWRKYVLRKEHAWVSMFLVKVAWLKFIKPAGTQTIYGYMPIKTAYEFIEAHGGIDLVATFTDLEKWEQILSDYTKED